MCKTFFLRTLDIGNKRFSNILKKKSADGIIETDKRGWHSPANKLQQSEINFVKDHIQSFAKYKSHYSRKNTPHKQYLDSSLSMNKMYDLYVELCKSQKKIPVKIHTYRNIFNKCFNLSFLRPYSDTCTTCDWTIQYTIHLPWRRRKEPYKKGDTFTKSRGCKVS